MKRLRSPAEQFLYRRGTAVTRVKTRVNCRVRRGGIPSRLNVGHQAVGFWIAAARTLTSFRDVSETQRVLRAQQSADVRASRIRFMSTKRNCPQDQLRDEFDVERCLLKGEEQAGDPLHVDVKRGGCFETGGEDHQRQQRADRLVMTAAARSLRLPAG
jgi:hypothetical protein